MRNFHIQTCKMALVSDIVVYGDHKTKSEDTIALAQKISRAQRQYESQHGLSPYLFNTFMLSGKLDRAHTLYVQMINDFQILSVVYRKSTPS